MDNRQPHKKALAKACSPMGLAWICLWGALANPAGAQERFWPEASAVVLATSVHGQGGRQAALRQLDQAWRAHPEDLNASLAYARAVFTLGLAEGDLRWFGSAKAALKPWWLAEDLPADGLFLRGWSSRAFTHSMRV